MKSIKDSGLILFLVSILSFGCTKETVKSDKVDFASSLDNTERSMTTFGSDYVQALQYVNNYEQQIFDSSQYCPIEFSESGQKVYDSNTKLKNRVIHYYDSIGYDVDGQLYDQFILDVEEYEYADLPRLGISSEEIAYMDDVNKLFSEVSQLTDLRDSISGVKTQIINDQRLSADASMRLLSSIDIFENVLSYGIGQGIDDIQDLDEDIILSMPCGAAVAFYAAAFVGLCAATGGLLVTVAVIGFGGSVWGVFDSC